VLHGFIKTPPVSPFPCVQRLGNVQFKLRGYLSEQEKRGDAIDGSFFFRSKEQATATRIVEEQAICLPNLNTLGRPVC